jgi:dolichyl-phosphate-mannose--protein O-mannosyl transferase
MKKAKRIFAGLSLKWDPLFFRNLTLILAAILIWRGVWDLIDIFVLPMDTFFGNLVIILVGIVLLFVFDSEVEEEEETNKTKKHKHRHLSDDLL